MHRRPTFCVSAVFLTCLAVPGFTGCTEPQPSPKPAANASTTAGKPAAKPPSAETLSAIKKAPVEKKVVLGDASLTAGIPGEGDLADEEIQIWLENPARHETLEVELPLGLSGAQQQIKGLDKNLLTRAKIELGRQLYFDNRLSKDGTVSCASCHSPGHGYAADTQFGVGVGGQTGGRNSPVAYNRILSDVQFWDGRAGTLEAQAVGPIANPIEMSNTHEACVKCIAAIPGYKMQFDKIFPGEGVTIDNVAKAIASFERTLVTGPAPYDFNERLKVYKDLSKDELEDMKQNQPEEYAQYEKMLADAKANPMSDSAKRGRELFFGEKAKCSACHVGANLTDEKYHNLGIGMHKEKPDLGRHDHTKQEADQGAFKTPTVRNVEQTAPYMHDGSVKTLDEVVEWYDKGGHPNPHLDKDIKKLNLTPEEKADLVAFMKACTGPLPKVNEGRLPK
ncbi:MAG: c-type cytochrome [Planctomycetes bacterium]|nr:c-type cytochrome [Planctomycetota bacterium]